MIFFINMAGQKLAGVGEKSSRINFQLKFLQALLPTDTHCRLQATVDSVVN